MTKRLTALLMIVALLAFGLVAAAQDQDEEQEPALPSSIEVISVDGAEDACHADNDIARIVLSFNEPGDVTMRAQAYTDFYDETTEYMTTGAGMLEIIVNAPTLPEHSVIQYSFTSGDPADTAYIAINCTTGMWSQGLYFGDDGRIAAGLDVPVVFYPLLDADGEPYWEFYTVDVEDPDRSGELSLRLTPDMLAEFERIPEQNTALAITRDGLATLYRLTTGQLQVNYAPDAEGKVAVVIFDGNRPRSQRADFEAN